MDTKRATILVDWDFYSYFHDVKKFVKYHRDNAKFILLVSNLDDTTRIPEGVFDVIITNTNNLKDFSFKTHAITAVQAMSNYEVVIALEPDYKVGAMYSNLGVLVILDLDGVTSQI